MNGIPKQAYNGAPRGIKMQFPDAPAMLERVEHWSFNSNLRTTPEKIKRERNVAMALSSLLAPPKSERK